MALVHFAGLSVTSAPDDYLADESTHEDLSARLVAYSIRRGRNHELDRIEAGTCTILLNNGDGELDPANQDGSYYGQLLPLRRVRVTATSEGSEYRLFDGLVERYEPEWLISRNDTENVDGYQRMQLGCVDATELLVNQLCLDENHAALETSLTGSNNDLRFESREHGGSDITIQLIDPNAFSTSASVAVSGRAIEYTQSQSASPLGLHSDTADSMRAILEASSEVMALISVTDKSGNDGSNFLNNTGSATAAIYGPTNLSGTGWASERTGSRIDRVLDSIGWDASARVLDAGLYDVPADEFSESDNTTVWQHISDCADSEFGYLFMDGLGRVVFHDGDHRITDSRSTTSQATYSDDGTGFAYKDVRLSLDRDRIYNSIRVTHAEELGLVGTAEDATSIASYLTRVYQKSTILASADDAQTLADGILEAYKDPVQRFVSVTLQDTGASGWAAAVLGREIGDLVTVRTNPPGHTTVVAYECFIEAVDIAVSAGVPMEVTFQLTPATVSVSGGGGGGGEDGGPVFDSTGDIFILDSGSAGVLG